MRGRLNVFQASMLRWRELHPYCASHVVTIAAPLEEARLGRAIGGVLEECGLTGFVLDEGRRRFDFEGGPPSVDLRIVDGGDAPFDVAAREIEATINAPFPRTGRFDPFRFFAVRAPGEFLLGLTYDHFIAGGDSIAVLLTDIADRFTAVQPAPLPLLDRFPATYSRLFAARAGYLWRGMLALPGLLAGWRTAIRPRLADPEQGHNGFAHFPVNPERAARVKAASKRWGITGNDIMLALVLRAVAPIAAQRSHTGLRTGLALASIVNLRADFERPAAEVFGQFLSSFRVVVPLPDRVPVAELAKAIAAQTSRAKRLKLYLVTLLAMQAAALMWAVASPRRRHRLFLKYHPVFAGLTPLNVNALRRKGASGDGDYLRAASTGPMSPMVVAVTTAGAALRVGITYRTTALSRANLDAVIASMVADMDELS